MSKHQVNRQGSSQSPVKGMVSMVTLTWGHTCPVTTDTHQRVGLWQQDNSRVPPAGGELILPEQSLQDWLLGPSGWCCTNRRIVMAEAKRTGRTQVAFWLPQLDVSGMLERATELCSILHLHEIAVDHHTFHSFSLSPPC